MDHLENSDEEYDDHEGDVRSPRSRSGGLSITGKRAVVSYGGTIVPSMFGQTTLEIDGERLIEVTRGIVSHRHAELLLSEVDSAEIVIKPNPALLAAGIATLILVVGFFILLFYFIIKYKFLVIHSGSNTTVVAIVGSEDPFHDFMDEVLTAAAKAKRHR